MGFKFFSKKVEVTPVEDVGPEDLESYHEPSLEIEDEDLKKNPKFKKVVIGDMKV
jgi:hypothetical protein